MPASTLPPLLYTPSFPHLLLQTVPAVPSLLVMSHPPYHICPQRNVRRLPDLNSPCITFRLATLTHLACVSVSSPTATGRAMPRLSCRASTIPTVPLPSIPLALTGFSMPAKILRASPVHSTPLPSPPLLPNRAIPTLIAPVQASPARPLHVQSLPDPDARRQPASAIPCLLSLPSWSSPRHYLSFASSPANPCHLSC